MNSLSATRATANMMSTCWSNSLLSIRASRRKNLYVGSALTNASNLSCSGWYGLLLVMLKSVNRIYQFCVPNGLALTEFGIDVGQCLDYCCLTIRECQHLCYRSILPSDNLIIIATLHSVDNAFFYVFLNL